MNSLDLEREGLAEWQRFAKPDERSLISSLPKSPGIYVIRYAQPLGRLLGQSDIFYIGSAVNVNGIKGRIRQYFHPGPTQSTNKRILALLDTMDNLEISFLECSSGLEAKELERQLLIRYEKDHSELPPLNRRR